MTVSSKQTGVDTPALRVPREHRQSWRGFMQKQMDLPETDTRWEAMCESLQRQGHGFEAAFSSALAHQIATPKSERIDPREAPISSFIFVDDPSDSNRYGHIVGKWAMGPGSLEAIPVVTNDVSDSGGGYDPGNVTIVQLGWFPRYWGDAIQFATTWFGGTEIPTFVPSPKQSGPEDTAEFIKVAIERAQAVVELMRKARRDNDDNAHPAHERAIQREIDAQKKIVADLRKLLP